MRSRVAATLLLTLFLGACGADEPAPDPEAEVRDAAADYLEAALVGDGEAACAELSEVGRRAIVKSAARADRSIRAEDCEAVFPALGLSGTIPDRARDKLDEYVSRVRDGEVPWLEVVIEDENTASLESTNSADFALALSKYDEGWLVDDGLDPLYGYGLNPVDSER